MREQWWRLAPAPTALMRIGSSFVALDLVSSDPESFTFRTLPLPVSGEIHKGMWLWAGDDWAYLAVDLGVRWVMAGCIVNVNVHVAATARTPQSDAVTRLRWIEYGRNLMRI